MSVRMRIRMLSAGGNAENAAADMSVMFPSVVLAVRENVVVAVVELKSDQIFGISYTYENGAVVDPISNSSPISSIADCDGQNASINPA